MAKKRWDASESTVRRFGGGESVATTAAGPMALERRWAEQYAIPGLVILVTLVSRLMYWPTSVIGKDGDAYINSLALDRTYNVPPPHNLGWVLVGKLFTTLGFPALDAYTITSILVSMIGTAYYFLIASRFLRPWTAAATTAAMALSPLVWYHGTTLASYEVWLCVPAAIAHYGLRYWEERRLSLLYCSALAAGLGTILRPDMVIFGGLLFAGVLVLGRAPLIKGWAVCGLICAACCCVWFFGTAAILGGVDVYLTKVRDKNDFHNTFGVMSRGLFEGLGRNGGKFIAMFLWGNLFVLPCAVLGAVKLAGQLRSTWRYAVLGVLALLPTLYFAIWIFMGNAGLELPATGLAFLLAGYGVDRTLTARGALRAMAAVGGLGAAQFMLAPLIEAPTDQRQVIYDVTFAQWGGRAIKSSYNWNLVDYGIDGSLRNALKQLRDPEPVPRMPGDTQQVSMAPAR